MNKTREPNAFLSHSSADKDLAERMARYLSDSHVKVWLDKWSLMPGDSIRQKIDEGIDDCTHFLVLLTPSSVKSSWVHAEMDAGFVNMLDQKSRFVPIHCDIEIADVPATLRGRLAVRVARDDTDFRELAEACLETDRQPTVGPLPSWASDTALGDLELSHHARRLAVLLNQTSKAANPSDNMSHTDELARDLEMAVDDIDLAVDELAEIGWVEVTGMLSHGKDIVMAQPELFFQTDPVLHGRDPQADAERVLGILVNLGGDFVRVDRFGEVVSWGARRLNVALFWLYHHDLVDVSHTSRGASDYAYNWVRVTKAGRRFAKGLQ